MRRRLIIYAVLVLVLQVLVVLFCHRLTRIWLDMFIHGYKGFPVRSGEIRWMIRLARLATCVPPAFLLGMAFVLLRRKSDEVLIHTLFAGLVLPLAVAGITASIFLAELTSGTWQPRLPQEQASEADSRRHQQNP